MNVESVTIIIKGQCDLERLLKLGYRKDYSNDLNEWFFDGVLHRYTFKYGMGDEVVITIGRKPFSDRSLPHRITFNQINSWVKKSVDRIQYNSRGRW